MGGRLAGGRPPPLRPVAPAWQPGLKAVCGPVAASPRAARRAWRASPLYANWLACPAPSLAAWGRCGWAARWVCGLRRGGSAPPVRGPPGGRGPGAPTSARGRWGRPLAGCGPPCGGGQPLPACVRPLRLVSRHSWRGPPPGPPRGGPRRPSRSPRRGPPGGAFRRRLRPVPLHGVGRRGIAAPWDAMRPTP